MTDHLRARGVSVNLGSQVQRIDADTVVLDDGSILRADLVVMAIGPRIHGSATWS